MKDESLVSVVRDVLLDGYPEAPFHPPTLFPELGHICLREQATDPGNRVYSAVRAALARLDLDLERRDTSNWNPLNGLAARGSHVVLKPNLVYHRHPLGEDGVAAMITHASVIRPLIDYVLLATDGDCRITICDVPLQTADWQALIRSSGLDELVSFYSAHGIDIDLLDLRYEISKKNRSGAIVHRDFQQRDPRGYATVDLGRRSHLFEIREHAARLEITDYGPGTVTRHHHDEVNEYLIAKTMLDADLFINVPKLKTHRKAGITVCLKNLVGINGDKSWIAHHRRGIDEYPVLRVGEWLRWKIGTFLKNNAPPWVTGAAYNAYRYVFLGGRTVKEHTLRTGGPLMEGSWHGNDTVWRTILDLNNIVFYADKQGALHSDRQRRYLAVVDGVVGMDREGPVAGTPKNAGLIAAGLHPVAVDAVVCGLMGFDFEKVPSIRNGFEDDFFGLTPFDPKQLRTAGVHESVDLAFAPPSGWKDFLERSQERGR